MDLTFGKKLFLLREEKQLTQEAFADLVGVSRQTINRWENTTTPPLKHIDKISEVLKIDKQYFLINKTPEYQPLTGQLLRTDGDNLIKLPVLARVPAGLPEWSEDDVESYIHIPRYMYPGASIAITVSGDSMEPLVQKNDIAIIRFMREPLNNRIMLVQCDRAGEFGWCLKRVWKEGGKIKLSSDNKKYETYIPKTVKIVGLLIGIQRKFENGG